jgi:hypothetical protein
MHGPSREGRPFCCSDHPDTRRAVRSFLRCQARSRDEAGMETVLNARYFGLLPGTVDTVGSSREERADGRTNRQ